MTHNHPYYISTLIRSEYPARDLTTPEGAQEVLTYEVIHKKGEIRTHWQEYIEYAFDKTNGNLAKAIILFLSQ